MALTTQSESKMVGYARCSTSGQTTAVQVAELKKAGCDLIYQETISTRVQEDERPELQKALAALEPESELVLTTLSRLGRTQLEVVQRLHDLQEKGIHIRTLDGLVSTKGLGKFAPVLIGLLSGINQVERELIRERTLESIQHRRATGGDLGGRPKTSEAKAGLVLRLREDGYSYRSIREQTGIALQTIRRIIKEGEQVKA